MEENKNLEEAIRYINVIRRACSLLEEKLRNDDGGLLEVMTDELRQVAVPMQISPIEQTQVVEQPQVVIEGPVVEQPVVAEEPPPEETPPALLEARKSHVSQLMEIDCWPEAVSQSLVGREVTEEDNIKRANSVLDFMFSSSLEGKTILDFGCGEGWVVQQSMARGVHESFGYDIKEDEAWGDRTAGVYTTEFETFSENQFDFVLLYDVLDHCEDPVNVMQMVKYVLKPGGSVGVRCHPWTAKHSSHVYKKGLNKAHVHLFLKWEEIKELIGEDPMFVRPETSPLEAYIWWFNEFEIVKERKITSPVSDFFHVPAFKELLGKEQNISLEQVDSMLEAMQIEFVDFSLKLK